VLALRGQLLSRHSISPPFFEPLITSGTHRIFSPLRCRSSQGPARAFFLSSGSAGFVCLGFFVFPGQTSSVFLLWRMGRLFPIAAFHLPMRVCPSQRPGYFFGSRRVDCAQLSAFFFPSLSFWYGCTISPPLLLRDSRSIFQPIFWPPSFYVFPCYTTFFL